MSDDYLFARLDNLTVWQRRGERAPHKPLLILLALGRFTRGETSLPFTELEPELRDLLREFGPHRQAVHPEYPFWRLQRDGLWEVATTVGTTLRRSNTDPTVRSLRSSGATGRFPAALQRTLSDRPSVVGDMARMLLDAHFPASIHGDILAAVGLSLTSRYTAKQLRDPAFRSAVLKAYTFNCVVCGLDIRIGNRTIALEAAHIRWHQAGGPDVVTNGVALCSLHHKLFDLGAMTISRDFVVLVSDEAHGGELFDETLMRHHGQPMRRPLHVGQMPDDIHLSWHQDEVFRGRPRSASRKPLSSRSSSS